MHRPIASTVRSLPRAGVFLLLVLFLAVLAVPGASAQGAPPVLDEEWALLADQIPGFAGWAFGSDGVPEVRLAPDPATPTGEPRAASRRALVETFGPEHRTVPVRHDFRALFEWKGAARALAVPGSPIAFLDIDEVTNRLVVAYDRATPPAAVRGLERSLVARGIPRDALELLPTEPPVQYLDLRDTMRPFPGGVEIGVAGGACTLGVNVRRANPSDPSGTGFDTGGVTAGHCGNAGATVTQAVGGSRIGVVKAFGPGYFSGCPAGYICKHADVMFIDYDSRSWADMGKIARSNATFPFPILSRSSIQSVLSTPAIGATVRKTGRTTGETSSRVNRTCMDTSLGSSTYFYWCLHQTDGDRGVFATFGDSGAPVFSPVSGGVQLHGLISGGTLTDTVFSPWVNVENDLGNLPLY